MKPLKGRSILITGADGFIGSHVAERLVNEGCDVHALAMYNSFGTAGWLDTLDEATRKALTIHFGDVRDRGLVDSVVMGRDIVLHMAALIAIPYSYQAPESFVDTNVNGTLNVLEAARRHGTNKVVTTSTSEVYGTPETIPISVTHPLKAQSPYAATKIAADQLCMSYAAAFGLNVAILRPFNTYGPRQSMRAVIPTILTQMVAGVDTVHLGSLHPRRDFTYVADTVDGFVRTAEADTVPGETLQLGTGIAVSIGELVELCRSITGSQAAISEDDVRVRPEASEVQVLLADPSGARSRLGWQAQTSLENGLRRTAEWISARGTTSRASEYHR